MEPDFPATPFTEALLKENEELRTENALLRERCSELEERVNKTVKTVVSHHRQMVIKSPVKKGVIKVIHLPKKPPAPHRKHRTPKALDHLQAINQVARKVIKALV